jgi:ABC-2 type transport system permease protein
MRNFWVIVKREYLQRVRTRSFLILTLLVPGIMTVVMMLPAKLATMGSKAQHVVVVTSTPQFGEMVRRHFLSAMTATDDADESNPAANAAKPKPQGEDEYVLDVDSNATEAERAALRDKVTSQAIDGYLWLSDDAIASGKVTWTSRNLGGFGESSRLSAALNRVIQYERLSKNGLTSEKADELLKPVKIEAIRLERGHEAKGSGGGKFLEVVIMVMLLYMAVLLYGISVMRSVLEEKTSRILEVLLSSATSTELMAGKLLGVGAVGLTQILVWVVIAGVFALPAMAMQPTLSEFQIPLVVLIAFAVFFLLGYLLYSTMYATIGAITTTEQEGQQLQFFIVIPLVLSVFMLAPVVRTPDAPAMVWLSMVPFFAPVLMYARIVVQTPPLWQIALSVFLLIGTIAGLLVLCARIYRVGILIYGKRPNLPEILKWLKYAKA